MPELPEVEVVRNVLDNSLKNLTITNIDCFYTPIIEDDINDFKKMVVGQKIVEVKRYAKYLIFILDNGAIISHLRMEGKYYYLPKEKDNFKHVHVVFYFDNDYKLMYADVRKFGRIQYKSRESLFNSLPLSKVGIEANNPNYDANLIIKKINNKKLPIKTVLLDQTIIAGLGNIYVDEVLFKSHINPLRIANTITIDELKLIMTSSQEILNKAIENKGTTIRSYTSSLGVSGNYQNFLCVHTKKICPSCNSNLEKIKIGGRTSYFCKNCQR